MALLAVRCYYELDAAKAHFVVHPAFHVTPPGDNICADSELGEVRCQWVV